MPRAGTLYTLPSKKFAGSFDLSGSNRPPTPLSITQFAHERVGKNAFAVAGGDRDPFVAVVETVVFDYRASAVLPQTDALSAVEHRVPLHQGCVRFRLDVAPGTSFPVNTLPTTPTPNPPQSVQMPEPGAISPTATLWRTVSPTTQLQTIAPPPWKRLNRFPSTIVPRE